MAGRSLFLRMQLLDLFDSMLFLLMLLACDWIKFNQLDPATIYEAQNAG
jgi:hypothetical protein